MRHKYAWLGLAAFGLSYALANIFVLVDGYESAVALWFVGLYGTLGMYAAIRLYQTGKPDVALLWVALLVANVLTREHTDFWAEYSLGPRLWSLTLLVLIAGTVWLIFREFGKDQLFERLIWLVLLVAFEGWAVVEYGVCKVALEQASHEWLVENWGNESSKYVCRRLFGEIIPRADQALAAAALVYITGRFAWARRSNLLDRG